MPIRFPIPDIPWTFPHYPVSCSAAGGRGADGLARALVAGGSATGTRRRRVRLSAAAVPPAHADQRHAGRIGRGDAGGIRVDAVARLQGVRPGVLERRSSSWSSGRASWPWSTCGRPSTTSAECATTASWNRPSCGPKSAAIQAFRGNGKEVHTSRETKGQRREDESLDGVLAPWERTVLGRLTGLWTKPKT